MKSCIWLTVVAVIGVGSIGSDVSRATPVAAEASPAMSNTTTNAATPGVRCRRVEGAQRDVSLQFELSGRIVEIPSTKASPLSGEVVARLDDAMWRHQLP